MRRFGPFSLIVGLMMLVSGLGAPLVLASGLAGEVERVSTSASGVEANGESAYPVWSPDGNRIAFSSWASNLIPGDSNGTSDIFVKDLDTGEVVRVSESSSGVEGNLYSFTPQWSPDGSKVAFYSYASTLVPDDTNGQPDVFVKDLATGDLDRVSTNAAGE